MFLLGLCNSDTEVSSWLPLSGLHAKGLITGDSHLNSILAGNKRHFYVRLAVCIREVIRIRLATFGFHRAILSLV